MTVLDEAEVRAILLKTGVPIKEIERMWLEKHGLRVVNWNVLKESD